LEKHRAGKKEKQKRILVARRRQDKDSSTGEKVDDGGSGILV